jgi:O-antigen biosynthesis protein WbqP
MYVKFKRAFDFLVSLLSIVALCPFLIIISLMIKKGSKGPVFFKQKRIGMNKKTFYILKFRTMREETPKDMPTHMLQNPDMYITKIGKFLRKTSLDELPQIINIIQGEMSIIGPRPALWNQFELIVEREKYGANDIRPGLTGWAQINGRDELPIVVKAALDGEYVRKMSLLFDLSIFIKTISSVLKSEGVSEGAKSDKQAE